MREKRQEGVPVPKATRSSFTRSCGDGFTWVLGCCMREQEPISEADGRSVDEGLADTAKEVGSVATEGGRRGRVEGEGFSQAAQGELLGKRC